MLPFKFGGKFFFFLSYSTNDTICIDGDYTEFVGCFKHHGLCTNLCCQQFKKQRKLYTKYIYKKKGSDETICCHRAFSLGCNMAIVVY